MSQTVTYAILAGVGMYCLSCVGYKTLTLPTLGYAAITAHGITGVLTEETDDENVKYAHKLSTWLEHLFPFPCMVGQLWLKYGIHKDLAYILPSLCVIPLIMLIDDENERDRDRMTDCILTVNLVAGLYACLQRDNWVGVGACLLFGITHGIIRLDDFDYKKDGQNLFSALFALLSLIAIGKCHIAYSK